MDDRKLIKPGDVITAYGYKFQVRTVLYQDYYGDRKDAGTSDCWGYDVEFKDTDGKYHHWKQNMDGGSLFRKGVRA